MKPSSIPTEIRLEECASSTVASHKQGSHCCTPHTSGSFVLNQQADAATTITSVNQGSYLTQVAPPLLNQQDEATDVTSLNQGSYLTQQVATPSYTDTNVTQASTKKWGDQELQWKLRFDKEVFGNEFSSNTNSRFRGDPSKECRHKNYSQADIDYIIPIVESWHLNKESDKNTNFRRENKDGFRWVKRFRVRTSALDGKTVKTLLRETVKGPRIVCAAEDVFNAIFVSHCNSIGHFATRKTKDNIDETYWNITKKQIDDFIKMCFVCNIRNDRVRSKDKGPGVSIKSAGFRDRFQVDLVDYGHDPRKDHNGVEMKWLLVVKDHHSKYVWLRALAKKEAILVTAELRHLFHEVGFPLIFHSDNGKEFLNKLVYGMIRDAEPHILTLTGPPRTPRVQGSVENANQHVKSIIARAIIEAKLQDPQRDIGWVDVLGPATSAMNNSACSSIKGLTPYRHVFSQDFEFPLLVPAKDRHKIRTITALDAYCNDPHLTQRLHSLGIDLNPPTNIPSNSPLRTTTQSSVTVATSRHHDSESIFKNESRDSLAYSASPTPNSTLSLNVVSDGIPNFQKTNVLQKVSSRRGYVRNALDVVMHDPRMREIRDTNLSFGFVLARLSEILVKKAKSSIIDMSIHLNIGDQAYYTYCFENSKRWWDFDFLTCFATLQALACQNSEIAFLDNVKVNYSTKAINRLALNYIPDPLHCDPSSVVTVAYRGGHYATLVLNRHTPTPMVTVYDGLMRTQKDAWKQWKYHIKYLVQRVMGESKIGYKNVHLAAEIGGIQMIQEDGYNCGLITCIVVWYLFNMAEARHIFSSQNFISLDDERIRKMVVLLRC